MNYPSVLIRILLVTKSKNMSERGSQAEGETEAGNEGGTKP